MGFGKKRSIGRNTPVWGGDIESYDKFLSDSLSSLNGELLPESKEHLLQTYGSQYKDVIALGDQDATLLEAISSDSNILKAEVIFGIRYEMAQT